jgi:hypothetical protein
MARRKQAPKDLTGIRQRGGTYQVRLFGGQDPVTGKQVMLTGSADDEDAAIKLRDTFRRQVAEATAARTSVTLGYLLDLVASRPPGRGDHPDELPRGNREVHQTRGRRYLADEADAARGTPVRTAIRRATGVPAAVQGTNVHRTPHASGARV